jgi:hypothetical protein
MGKSSFQQVIRFLLRFILIATIIFVCDRGIGSILKLFYFRQESGTSFRTTYSIDSTYSDILIFGSSRANHSYVPEIFEKRLYSTCYNTGKENNFILYNYALIRAITNRYNPKMIIIDILPRGLKYDAIEYERLSTLLPYYQTHPEIRYIIDLRGPFEKIKHLSTIYPYNSMILQIATGNLEYNKQRRPDINGYVPLIKTMKNVKIDTSKISTYTIDENKTRALKDIISTCQQKNIDLVFVISPYWGIIRDSLGNSMLSELCSVKGVRYLDMSDSPVFINNPEFFADISHLNDKGARVFTAMLINKIWQTN